MRLLALSAAAVTVPIVTLLNWIRAYQKPLLLALAVPVLLLILVAEPHL